MYLQYNQQYLQSHDSHQILQHIPKGTLLRPKKINLVFMATVLKTLGRVGSVFFLRIETSIIKTPTKKKHGIFVKKRV